MCLRSFLGEPELQHRALRDAAAGARSEAGEGEPLGAVLERLQGQLAAARPPSSEPAVAAAAGIHVGCAP